MSIKKIDYNPDKLTDFDREWMMHKKCREWWYATGILFDEEKNMYSYQYTLLSLKFGPIHLYSAMVALTDYKNNKHYYLQNPTLKASGITINEKEATMQNVASARKNDEGIDLELTHSKFHLKLHCDYGKGAFWHCDDGKLQMGISDPKETTMYFSYTNLPTSGEVVLNGKRIKLSGKTWFDKQGGTYTLTDLRTQWEWFSLRFFDDEEVMLFTFNDSSFNDGTYITADGRRTRLNDYKIERTKVTTFNGMKWSAGWKIYLGIKEDEYIIEPVQEGHINFAYFEELCYVKNASGELKGYCFAELLPGILNKADESTKTGSKSSKSTNLFKRIEY